jgi:hypothetical protein
MAKQFPNLNDQHRDFIDKQHIYFVATAGKDGHVNVSPKGMDTLKIVAEDRLVWLNYTGSGNETAAHILESNRMTIMFCSFAEQPLILRVYGEAELIYRKDKRWSEFVEFFPESPGSRQIFDVKINLVQTSCGFGVPFYEYQGERPTLEKWAEKKGARGIEQYWQENNQVSMDGKDTGLLLD